MQNKFENVCDVFLDYVDAKEYVQLERILNFYEQLKSSVQKPLKIILLFGRPGTGKSMLLQKLYNDMLLEEHAIFLYSTPIVDENTFYQQIFHDLFPNQELPDSTLNITLLQSFIEEANFDQVPIILLDESQLYSQYLMERIRLLSDSRLIKFVLTLHKTEEEDLIAKEHFQTRIWESIELTNLKEDELKMYIQKKLMQHNYLDIANMFDDENIHTIFTFTQGNYRNTNKLLYTIFNIYDWYSKHQKGLYLSTIHQSNIAKEIIEMAAIETGFIHD